MNEQCSHCGLEDHPHQTCAEANTTEDFVDIEQLKTLLARLNAVRFIVRNTIANCEQMNTQKQHQFALAEAEHGIKVIRNLL